MKERGGVDMSYYAVKSVSFDEKNNCIRMTVADSSIRPFNYFSTEINQPEKPYKEKVSEFFMNCMDGNYHLSKVNKKAYKIYATACDIYKKCSSKFKEVTGQTLFDASCSYNCDYDCQMERFIADNFCVIALCSRTSSDAYLTLAESVMNKAKNLICQFNKDLTMKNKSDKENGIVRISCASHSPLFNGLLVLVSNENEVIVCGEENYTSGKLRNADNTAINFGSANWQVLHDMLHGAYTGYDRKTLAKHEPTLSAIERIEECCSKNFIPFIALPYKGFNVSVK